VAEVEAVRQLAIGRNIPGERQRAVVLAGSFDCRETELLVDWAKALAEIPNVEVWFKPHPANAMLPFPERKGPRPGWRVRSEPLGELFGSACAAILGGTSAALEAVAAGCVVIVPVFADVLSMTPLPDDCPWMRRVSDSAGLVVTVRDALATRLGDAKRRLEFVKSYWHLDSDLRRWRVLATVTGDGKGIVP
jgi:hypothetical protein